MEIYPPRSSTSHPFGHDFEDVSHHGSPFYQCILCRAYQYDLKNQGRLEEECPEHRTACERAASRFMAGLRADYESKRRAIAYEAYLERTLGPHT